MKQFLTILLALCLVLPMPVHAADSGTWGSNITWHFDGDTLTVTGTGDGKMADFSEAEKAPWYLYKDQIKKLVLVDVYYIGARAFRDYDALTRVDFGEKLYEIGPKAFQGCDGLTVLNMPASFKVFGEECLRGCKNLEIIYSLGRFPSFRLNCLWDVKVKILYPEASRWSADSIQDLEEAFRGRIQFMTAEAANYTPTYDVPETTPPETTPPETTPAPTTPPPTTPGPTTPPPTTPAPTTPPETTSAPSTAPATTPAPPAAPAPGNKTQSIWTGIAIILGILSLGGLLAGLMALGNSRRSKRSRW